MTKYTCDWCGKAMPDRGLSARTASLSAVKVDYHHDFCSLHCLVLHASHALLPEESALRPSEQMQRLAGALYSAYRLAVGGKNFAGDPLPGWPEFSADPAKKKQADGWLACAQAAVEALRPQLIDLTPDHPFYTPFYRPLDPKNPS